MIAVLAGGPSCEREISLISGKAVAEALALQGFSVMMLDPVGDFVTQLKAKDISQVFVALHGTYGEDGTVQRILEEAGLSYTGSGSEASRLAFDKSKAQRLFQDAGICVPAFQILKKCGLLPLFTTNSFPCVVKPACSGSSVGISIVHKPEEIHQAINTAFKYSDTVLIETYVHGRELTVGILGNEALPIVEVISGRKFYDYEAKYHDSTTRYECPAQLDGALSDEIKQIALKAYHVLGCEVMARVDVILSDDEKPFVLEINTIPGLTGKSLLPKAARAAGIDFPALCARILELSKEARRAAWQSQ